MWPLVGQQDEKQKKTFIKIHIHTFPEFYSPSQDIQTAGRAREIEILYTQKFRGKSFFSRHLIRRFFPPVRWKWCTSSFCSFTTPSPPISRATRRHWSPRWASSPSTTRRPTSVPRPGWNNKAEETEPDLLNILGRRRSWLSSQLKSDLGRRTTNRLLKCDWPAHNNRPAKCSKNPTPRKEEPKRKTRPKK